MASVPKPRRTAEIIREQQRAGEMRLWLLLRQMEPELREFRAKAFKLANKLSSTAPPISANTCGNGGLKLRKPSVAAD